MLTFIIFVAILAVLVLSHEFGHFIMARRVGIKVEEFGFGFPPRIFGVQMFKEKRLQKIARTEEIDVLVEESGDGRAISEKITDRVTEIDKLTVKRSWRFVWGNDDVDKLRAQNTGREGTVYSLNLIPLGGFVRIKGEDGSYLNDPDSFSYKKNWQKFIVIASGVLMNVILAAILLSIGYSVGLPQILDGGTDPKYIKDRRLEVAETLSGKPAEMAGIKMGDVIIKVGNLENPEARQMQQYVDNHKTEEILLSVRRGGEILSKNIKPIVYEDTGKGGFGIALVELGTVSYPAHLAVYHGVVATGSYLKEIVLSFGYLFKGLFSGKSMSGEVAGPVGIAVLTGKVARMGITYLIQFTAVLSLNLALINILPIPALDGGRLLFLAIAGILRRPVNQRLEQAFHTAGFALLMVLILAVTIKDLRGLGGFFEKLF